MKSHKWKLSRTIDIFVIIGILIALFAITLPYIRPYPTPPTPTATQIPPCPIITEPPASPVTLVLIAQFMRMSGQGLSFEEDWADQICDATSKLENVNISVQLISEIIEDDAEARAISDDYDATLVIWGEVAPARIESNYTVTPRWGNIGNPPGITNFRVQTNLDELTIFVSSEAGDTLYVVNFVLGQLLFFSDNQEAALDFFTEAIRHVPREREMEMGAAAVYFYRGYINLNLGNYTEAIDDYTEGIRLASQIPGVYLIRGYAYYERGDYVEAINDYTLAIQGNSRDAEAYHLTGLAHEAMGEVEAAAQDYATYIEMVQGNEIIADPLESSQIITLPMVSRRVHRLPFEAQAGQMITVRVDSRDGVDPIIVLVSPDEEPLIGNDDIDPDNDVLNSAIEDYEAQQTGIYTLVVTHAGGGSNGNVEVLLELSD